MAVHPIIVGQRRLGDYAGFAEPETLAAIRWLAQPLAGLRVLHLSASPFGSAVAETLATLVPLQRDLGIATDWKLVNWDGQRAWAAPYEGLKGSSARWTRSDFSRWYSLAQRDLSAIDGRYDLIVAHDPQVLPLGQLVPQASGWPRRVWHCHLDTRGAAPGVWAKIGRSLYGYDAILFPAPELVRTDVPVPYVGVAQPALDPCSPANAHLEPEATARILIRLGIDPGRPVIGQFSLLDRRFAPLLVLATHKLVRWEIPGVQLLFVERRAMAAAEPLSDDLSQLVELAAGDPDTHFLLSEQLGATEVNALQRSVVAALQLAVPFGFGWGIAECQLKGRPAIVGARGLLPDQVGRGADGWVADGAAAAAAMVLQLIQEPELAAEVGARGRERVKRDYVITRLLADYVRLFRQLTAHPLAASAR